MKIFRPLSILFTGLSFLVSKPFQKHRETQVTVTEDELNDLVENISEEDGIDEETGRLVKSALQFSNSSVQDIMVPWGEVIAIRTSMKTPEILELIQHTNHSRLPVVDRKGNVKGILQIRKFLKAYTKTRSNVILASVMDYPYFLRANIPIDDALTEMSNHRRNLAFVRAEGGEVVGILTVEDILEELVGEIYDETDEAGDRHE